MRSDPIPTGGNAGPAGSSAGLRRLLILALVAGIGHVAASQAQRAPLEPVAYPIDGDTLVMESGETVRVENVDTPELHCECASECRRALAAAAFTRHAVAGGVILIRRERGDRYGRTIARVTLSDGRDLGEALVAQGLARPWRGRREGWCLPGEE